MTQFANAISSLGINVDECVSLFLKNSAEFAVAAYGTALAGTVLNPVNYRLAPADVVYILSDCNSKLILFEEDTRETIEQCLDDLETVEHFIYIDDDVTDIPEYAIGFHSLLTESSMLEPPSRRTELGGSVYRRLHEWNDWPTERRRSHSRGRNLPQHAV